MCISFMKFYLMLDAMLRSDERSVILYGYRRNNLQVKFTATKLQSDRRKAEQCSYIVPLQRLQDRAWRLNDRLNEA